MPAPARRIDQRDVQEYLRRIEKLGTELVELRGSVARSVAPVEVTADNAQTTAASKTVVLRTITAPSGDDAVPQNLWLPPGTNTPHALDQDSGEWLPIPDKTATDAAAAAAEAASLVGDVQVDLGTAQDQINDAQQKLNDAFAELGDLDTATDEAKQAARDAADAASSAAATATSATQAASTAQSTADAANTAAANANKAALDASGLAASKGEVIVQVSAPTGSRANPANLWIDISGSPAKNTPNRYNTSTSKWEPVTDQKALDAAAAASAASTAAQTAQTTADAAKAAAGTAQTAATKAQGTADQAQQTAGTAASNAQAAIVSAAAAQGTADSATTKANAANAAALAAAGIANGKGTVYAQASAPTPVDSNGLWIDSDDGNKPYRGVDYGAAGSNLAADPQARSLGTIAAGAAGWVGRWFGNGGGDGTGTMLSGRSDTPVPGITSFARKTWTKLGTAVQDVAWSHTNGGTNALQVTPGATLSAASYIRGSRTQPTRDTNNAMYVQWLDSSGAAIGTAVGTSDGPMTAGVWVRYSISTTVPTNAAYAVIWTNVYLSVANWQVGDTLDGTGLIIRAAAPGAYFDGSFLGASWAGTPFASRSSYAGPAWVPVQDQGIVAAAKAAGDAQTAANAAQTAANNAGQAAAAAQTTANTAKTNAATAQTAADTAKANAAAAAAQSTDYVQDPQLQTGADRFRSVAYGSPADANGVNLPNGATGYGRVTANDNIADATAVPAIAGRTYRFTADVRPGAAWGTGDKYHSFMVWYLTGDGASSNNYFIGGNVTFAAATDGWMPATWEYTVPANPPAKVFRPSMRAGSNVYLVTNLHVRDVTEAKAAAAAAAAAQSAADTAKTNAAAAQTAADAAKAAAATADGKAVSAQSTADTAKANAATAQSAAQAAQSTADTAKTNAATAQSSADSANSQALSAAGIANGKGRVIYQASAPTGANASANNLWIRTSDNAPFTYDATNAKWVQATDATATNAASAAATANTAAGTAKTAADNAASAASAAQQTANQAQAAAAAAQTTANGRPQILFGTGTPVGTAPQGSTWFQVDSSGNVIGQWQQTAASSTGSTWTARQMTSAIMAGLDVAKLTAGTAALVDAVVQKIAAQTANLQTANIANLFVTSGATLSSAVIEALYAQVVKAHQITADMIDVGSLNGVTLTGVTLQTAATGKRTVLGGSLISFYDDDGNFAGSVEGLRGANGSGGSSLLSLGPGGRDSVTAQMYIGKWSIPTGFLVGGFTPSFYTAASYVDDLLLAASGTSLLVPGVVTSSTPGNWSASATGATTVTTFTFNSPINRPVRIKYASIIDAGGSNIGGSWALRLNGVQLGITEGIGTPGSVKGSWQQVLNKPGRFVAGTNTIQLVVTKESASATIYGNRNTIEVEG